MSAPTLTQDGELFVIDFGDDLNTTDHAWVDGMNALLDEVDAATGPKVLVTTGTGKHYSNGLDVEWMSGKASEEIVAYVNSVEKVLGRILTFPAPTVAAINGHAFGAGAFSVIAHDHAVMRDDRGFAMIRNLLPPAVARESIVTGRRYAAGDAVAAGFVDRAVPLDELLTAAADLGLPHAATAEGSIAQIKKQLHRDVMDVLGTG